MATQIGPKIGIEGEKEYRQQLQQIIQQTKTLDSAMKKTTAEWDSNTSALSKNRAAAQSTQEKIELFNKRLEIQNELLAQSVEKFGESSVAAQKYQEAVNSTQATIASLNNSLKSYKGAESFSDLSVKMADMGTKMQNIGQNMTAIGQKMSMSLTLPLVAAGTAAIKFASDTEEAANKVDVVFGTMSEQVKQFADDALNSYGLAEGTALQMAGTFGSMATAMGLSQQQAASMSTSLTALAADMASFYNVSTDVAQTSLQGVFTGETEALKKFGIVMTQTNLEEFAAQQGKVYSKMSEGEKVLTRYAFVMDATKDAQGDFARTSDGAANSFRVLQESLKELASAFGQELLPIITPIVQKVASIIQAFSKLPEPVKKVIVVLGLIVAAIGPVVMIIGMFVSSLGSIITAIPAVISGLTGLAGALGLVDLAAAPVIGIMLAIAAAIAVGAIAGYELAKHWDEICDAAGRMASAIGNAYNSVMSFNESLKNSVNGAIEDIVSYFASLPSRVVNALKNTVNAIKNEFKQMIQNAKQSGSDFVSGFIDGIKSKVQPLIDQVKKIAKTIEDYLGFSTPDKGPLHYYNSWMPDFLNGLAKGIKQNEGVVASAMNSLAKTMSLPLDANASMNMALAGADGGSVSVGGTSMNVYVDHINDLQDLIRIQNQAQQRYRMGAK